MLEILISWGRVNSNKPNPKEVEEAASVILVATRNASEHRSLEWNLFAVTPLCNDQVWNRAPNLFGLPMSCQVEPRVSHATRFTIRHHLFQDFSGRAVNKRESQSSMTLGYLDVLSAECLQRLNAVWTWIYTKCGTAVRADKTSFVLN